MSVFTWVVLGAAVISRVLGSFSWEVIVYSVLSLTLIRMLPVFLCLWGSGLRSSEKLFVGWFGPCVLASIVFAVIVLDAHLPGGGGHYLT
jgi:NhaP-type Na+/H+ or K+/H+ antiporter